MPSLDFGRSPLCGCRTHGLLRWGGLRGQCRGLEWVDEGVLGTFVALNASAGVLQPKLHRPLRAGEAPMTCEGADRAPSSGPMAGEAVPRQKEQFPGLGSSIRSAAPGGAK